MTYVGKEITYVRKPIYGDYTVFRMEIYICPSSPREELIHLLPEQMGHHRLKREKSSEFLKGKSHKMDIFLIKEMLLFADKFKFLTVLSQRFKHKYNRFKS